jgi:para-nitrobenzyl esterase
MKRALFFIFIAVFAFYGCENTKKTANDKETVADDEQIADNEQNDEAENDDENVESYETVTVSNGLIKGVIDKDVVSFKGVPYAAPPVGELRWSAPVKSEPWEGTFEAKDYSKACPQSVEIYAGYIPPWSEDCLYLNVFRPDTTEKDLPVMVFIHGGGYVNGAASLPTYEGAWLASQGIVLVTINYRLGQFGFLAVPDTGIVGNFGTLDQIAALVWVKENISSFGGNSENVTIFGESAGAKSVGTMIALRPDLFKRAVIQSGTIDWGDTMKKEDADDQGTRFVEAAGCQDAENIKKCLKDMPADEVLETLESGFDAQSESYGPHVDGELFIDVPYKMAISGDGKKVPLIIGTNSDEGTVFTYAYKDYIQTEEQYEQLVTTQFGATAAPFVLAEYPASDYESPWHAYTDLFADLTFNCSTILMARDFAKYNKNIHYYRFSKVPDYGAETGLGCFHGAELGYLFNTWADNYKESEAGYAETVENISGLWLKFALDGTLDEWPVYDSEEKYLDISDTLTEKAQLEKKNCDFWSQWMKP